MTTACSTNWVPADLLSLLPPLFDYETGSLGKVSPHFWWWLSCSTPHLPWLYISVSSYFCYLLYFICCIYFGAMVIFPLCFWPVFSLDFLVPFPELHFEWTNNFTLEKNWLRTWKVGFRLGQKKAGSSWWAVTSSVMAKKSRRKSR